MISALSWWQPLLGVQLQYASLCPSAWSWFLAPTAGEHTPAPLFLASSAPVTITWSSGNKFKQNNNTSHYKTNSVPPQGKCCPQSLPSWESSPPASLGGLGTCQQTLTPKSSSPCSRSPCMVKSCAHIPQSFQPCDWVLSTQWPGAAKLLHSPSGLFSPRLSSSRLLLLTAFPGSRFPTLSGPASKRTGVPSYTIL